MFKPGQSGNPNGRPKGSGNIATAQIKKAYQELLENNLENMNGWLARMASEDEGKALDFMLKLSEYILPKLARTEMTGADGEDLFKNLKFEFGTETQSEDPIEE